MRLALFFASALGAQTLLPIDQLKGPPGEVRLLGLDARGNLTKLSLGPGLVVEGNTIKAVPTLPSVPTISRLETVLTRSADGSYTVPFGCGIYRNGLLMSAGVDYTRTESTIRPTTPWAVDDLVVGVIHRVMLVSNLSAITLP